MPVEARFSAPVQAGPAVTHNGDRVSSEVKRSGRGVDHPPHLTPRLNRTGRPVIVPPYVPSWVVTG
jgi:hypothetical protein